MIFFKILGDWGNSYFVIIFTDEKILRVLNNLANKVMEVKESSRILTWVFWPHSRFSPQTYLIPEFLESFFIVQTERGEEFFVS